MTNKLNLLKYTCLTLGVIWTAMIVFNVAKDFATYKSNYFGNFFGILAAAALIAVGDLFFWLVYFFGKRFLK